MFFERLWTRANKPAVIVADDVGVVAVERALDAGPAEGDDKSIVRWRASVVRIHGQKFPNCPASAGLFLDEICGGSSRGDRARLLVASGARQPSKKLAQVVIGDERAASELARYEVSVTNRAVHGIAAEASQRARLRDAMSAAADVGNGLRHVCRPALGAVGLTANNAGLPRHAPAR